MLLERELPRPLLTSQRQPEEVNICFDDENGAIHLHIIGSHRGGLGLRSYACTTGCIQSAKIRLQLLRSNGTGLATCQNTIYERIIAAAKYNHDPRIDSLVKASAAVRLEIPTALGPLGNN